MDTHIDGLADIGVAVSDDAEVEGATTFFS